MTSGDENVIRKVIGLELHQAQHHRYIDTAEHSSLRDPEKARADRFQEIYSQIGMQALLIDGDNRVEMPYESFANRLNLSLAFYSVNKREHSSIDLKCLGDLLTSDSNTQKLGNLQK